MSLRNFVLVGVPLAALLSSCGGGTQGEVDEQGPPQTLAASADAAAQAGAQIPLAAPVDGPQAWRTIANSATPIPGADGRTFNSFNQPSINANGIVVMRGRSKGAQGAGEPSRGVYMRDMSARSTSAAGTLTVAFDTGTVVPQPNNIDYQGSLATFTEFPSFPRIGVDNATVATRGQSRPVWAYTLPDGSDTRVGTSGVYAVVKGARLTAASQVGQVPGFGHFSVPGAPAGTKFDQFPGAPAVAGPETFVFKGNYTDGVGKTGIFARNTSTRRGPAATLMIAGSNTLIPGQPADGVRFGSTAPPSAADNYVVFLGLDNEDSPTLGGIYRARIESGAALEPLVTIGSAVPGEDGAVFTRLGEALSFDGQYVSFWGAWGPETRTVNLACPADGQAALLAYCNEQHPQGHAVQVPVHQVFFVYDLRSRTTFPVAKTGPEYLDFMYWVFSGRPPGVGEAEAEEPEPPRWRASAFASAFAGGSKGGQVAFKARRTGEGVVDGIYLAKIIKDRRTTALTVTALVETGMQGQLVDPQAPANSQVITVGLEREGLRNGWLAIAVGMLDSVSSEGWAGVYVTRTR